MTELVTTFDFMLLHDIALLDAITSGALGLEPFEAARLQGSSVDLLLDNHFAIVDTSSGLDMDVRQNNSERAHRISVGDDDYFLLRSEHFVLASTRERVQLGNGYAGRIEGKSSLGRLGLMVHSTAGFIDPGFEGTITLELSNMLDVPIRLYPGMPIAQLCVFLMAGPAHKPYSTVGKYQHQTGPTTSLYHRNFVRETDDDLNQSTNAPGG